MKASPVAIVIVAAAPLIGLFILGRAILHIVKGWQRKNWSVASGEILESEVKVDAATGAEGGVSYRPVVLYRYRVNGAEYTSTRVTLSVPPLSPDSPKYSETIVARYPAHKQADVYYNPDNPQEAASRYQRIHERDNSHAANRRGFIAVRFNPLLFRFHPYTIKDRSFACWYP